MRLAVEQVTNTDECAKSMLWESVETMKQSNVSVELVLAVTAYPIPVQSYSWS